MAHVAESDLAAFLAGRLEPEAVRRVVRHLVAGCAECRARLRAVVPAGMLMPERRAGSPAGEPYGAAIDRARRDTCRLATRLRKDREQIERALERIREHPEGFNGLTWGERQSVRGWKHVEVCLAVSFDLRHRDPRQMLSFAEAAQEVADRIAPPVYGAAFLLDLRARAWGELANALRVNERFDRAEAALKQARSLVEEGTGDSIIEARLDEIEASLRKDQRQLEKAYRLLDQAHRTWLKIGDRHLAGRVMVIKGLTLIVDGEPLQAARVLRQAVDLLDVGRDPELAAAAHHDLLFALVESGRFGEAGKLLFEGALRRLFAGAPLNLLRLRGLDATILVGRGRVADAERGFRDVR